jgi:hypothetical protein
LSRHVIAEYVNEWTAAIHDCTELTRKIHALLARGDVPRATALLPKERVYPVPREIGARLGML